MTEHTPGPWTAYLDNFNPERAEFVWSIESATNPLVATVEIDRPDINVSRDEFVAANPEAYANACLIAAAPDLLAAARLVAEACDLIVNVGSIRQFGVALTTLNVAIAKADQS